MPVSSASASAFGARRVGRENRRRQAELAVVHEPHRLLVRGDLHDADRRTEGLLAHDGHGVIDVHQHLRREIRRSAPRWPRTWTPRSAGVAPRARASRTWARTASAAAVRTTGPIVVCGSSGDPKRYLLGQLDHAVDEFLVARRRDVDALDAAAGLAGIEKRAVGQGFDGVRKIGIGCARRRDPCRRVPARRSQTPRRSRQPPRGPRTRSL